jgi:hypothetical protein
MFRVSCIPVVAFTLCAACVGQEPKKDAVKVEADVHLMNSSTMRVNIVSEKLEIETQYGKLAVPIKHVRSIEFGLHMPAGHVDKIDAAVKRLGHSDFREREKAATALVDLGPYSYAAALEATRAKEAEAANRAKTVVQRLHAKFQRKDLKTDAEDKVVTPKFTIVGRIVTPALKVNTEYFGDADLSLSAMRTLRSIGGATPDVEVAIDAGKFAVQGKWMATGYFVDGKSGIYISAKGQVDLAPDQGGMIVGPNGQRANNPFGAKVKIKGNVGGLLIGKIGEDGDSFVVGDRYEGTPVQAGTLYLHINPSPYGSQSTGSYDVRIMRKTD